MLNICDAAALTEWALANGAYIHEAVHAGVPCDKKGLGVVLRTAVEQAELLLRVPHNLLIGAALGELEAAEGPRAVLQRLLSLRAGVSGESTFWEPYLRCLPATFDTTIFWSDAELDELQGSPVRSRSVHRSKELRAEHGRFEQNNASYRDFVWAYSITTSRIFRDPSIPAPGGIALVPIVDWINAATVQRPNVRWAAGAEGVSIYATTSLAAGTELLFAYGASQSSAVGAIDYGHAERLGAEDEIVLLSSPPRIHQQWGAEGVACEEEGGLSARPTRVAYDERRHRLEMQGLWGRPAIPLTVGLRSPHPRLRWAFGAEEGDGDASGVGATMMRVAMLLVAEHEAAARWTRRERRLALCLVRSHAKLLLRVGYPTPLEDDEIELEAEPVGTRLHTALVVRMAEKRLVGALITNISRALARRPRKVRRKRVGAPRDGHGVGRDELR